MSACRPAKPSSKLPARTAAASNWTSLRSIRPRLQLPILNRVAIILTTRPMASRYRPAVSRQLPGRPPQARRLKPSYDQVMSESDQQTEDRVSRFGKWLSLGGSIIAPATLITTLLFYFGYVSSRAQYDYFGVDVDTIGLTTQDYVVRSPQPLLVPLAGPHTSRRRLPRSTCRGQASCCGQSFVPSSCQ